MPDRDPDPAAVEALARWLNEYLPTVCECIGYEGAPYYRKGAADLLAALDAGRVPNYGPTPRKPLLDPHPYQLGVGEWWEGEGCVKCPLPHDHTIHDPALSAPVPGDPA